MYVHLLTLTRTHTQNVFLKWQVKGVVKETSAELQGRPMTTGKAVREQTGGAYRVVSGSQRDVQ